jgi:DnaK suppressor protein
VTDAQREELRKLLLALHGELTGKTPLRIEPNRTDDARVGGDEDEQPLNEMIQTIASNRNRSDAATLALVRRALEKLASDPDSFGECEECGDEIAPGRLKAMPYAQLCVACQGKKDPRTLPTRKRLTDYV